MFGLGEVCASSGGNDVANSNGTNDPLGRHNGMFYHLSDVTGTARSINGWLGVTRGVEGGTDPFNLSPEECWTQILGPAGLEDGNRTIHQNVTHVEGYWSRHRGGANFLVAAGSVHFLKARIGVASWRALAPRNGGETISADQY